MKNRKTLFGLMIAAMFTLVAGVAFMLTPSTTQMRVYAASDYPVVIAETDSISAIQTAIQNAIDGAASGDTITVTGSKTDADGVLSLALSANKTVIWKGAYATNNSYSSLVIELSGAGIFDVAEGGSISTEDGSRVIFNTSLSVSIVVSGGEVSSTRANGTTIDGRNGSVTVSGGTVKATGMNGIAIATTCGNVTVTGGEVIGGANNGYAIKAYQDSPQVGNANVLITGGEVKCNGSGMSNGTAIGIEMGNAVITGGLVQSSKKVIEIDDGECFAAYLSGTCTGSGFSSNGIIVEVDTLKVPISRNNSSTGLTVKAGLAYPSAPTAKWDTMGGKPVIQFSIQDGRYSPSTVWGEKATEVSFTAVSYDDEGGLYDTHMIEIAFTPNVPNTPNFTLSKVSIASGTGSATLSGSDPSEFNGKWYISVNTQTEGTISISIDNFDDYIITPSTQSLTVYRAAVDTRPELTYTVEQVGGSSGIADSTGIVITFSQAIDEFAYMLSGFGGSVEEREEDRLTGSGTTWTIHFSAVKEQGNLSLVVMGLDDYKLTTEQPVIVMVYRATRTAVSFTATQVGGTSGTANTTDIKIIFDKSVTGLTANKISITSPGGAGAGVAVLGATLSGSGTTYTINLTSVTTQGNIIVCVEDWGLFEVTTVSQTIAVYKDSRTQVTFTAEQYNGVSGTADSTGIKITFSPAVAGLTSSDVTITNGTGSVTGIAAPVLSAGVWYITFSVAAQGNVTVSVASFGSYNVTTTAQTVAVYKDTRTYVTITNTKQIGGTSGTADTTGIELTFDTSITGLTASDITLNNIDGNVNIGTLSGSGKNWTIGIAGVVAEGEIEILIAPFGNFVVQSAPRVTVYKDTSVTKHTVIFTIDGGVGGTLSAKVDGNSILSGAQVAEGKTVIFTATPSANYKFAGMWVNGSPVITQDGVYSVEDLSGACEVVVYFELETYAVNWSVIGGNGSLGWNIAFGLGSPIEHGTEVIFTASPNAGYRVKQWLDGGTPVNNKNLTYTITITSVRTISVEFELIPATPDYEVTVNNGTGTDYYVAGVTVTITANAAQTGKIFDKWITTDGVVFADASSATTTFIMPNKAVTVTATYKDWPTEPEYTIISGANGSVKIDSANGYTFTISGDYSKFDRLEVTGVTLIKGVDYTAASGSTIITITKTGLEKIGIGTKTITAHFIDGGTVTTTLTINAAAGNGGGNTGLIIGIAAGVVVLLGSGFCLYWFVIRKKKVAQ